MKKALALVMAIAMIASLAVVAMADTQINPGVTGYTPVVQPHTILETYTKSSNTWTDKTGVDVPFGTTLYVELLDANWIGVSKADAVKGLTVSAKWTQNGEYVKSVEIAKVGGQYVIAIATTGSSLEEVVVLGEIAVKGKSYYEVEESGKLVGKKADVKFDFDVEIDLAYAPGTAADVITLADGEKAVYNFEGFTPAAADGNIEVNFGELSAEVSPKGVKKVLFAYNDNVNEALYDEYLDADLTFINCTAAFRRTATVTLDLASDEYFYEVVDGKLVAVEGEYDEWTEEFTFKTRTMGNYVISDMELVVEEVAAANPSTGAAA